MLRQLKRVVAKVYVQHDNIRVIQGRYRLRLAPESGQSLCILSNLIGQKLQSHKAVQSRILGFVDHPHPATAEFLDQAVVRNDMTDHAQACYGGNVGKSMKALGLAIISKVVTEQGKTALRTTCVDGLSLQ